MAASFCECCEKRQQVTQGLCYTCILSGLKTIKDEEDPNLERYRELSGRVVKQAGTLLRAAR